MLSQCLYLLYMAFLYIISLVYIDALIDYLQEHIPSGKLYWVVKGITLMFKEAAEDYLGGCYNKVIGFCFWQVVILVPLRHLVNYFIECNKQE